nr:radial spoke protein 14-like isoform X2 [Physcomitrium patens]|eukprot:XP_024358014.1 radial spoke protein 14-like isoform X2 [Physcomitrella patens]
MPPLEDDTVRQCKAWWYADQQIRTEDMTRFVNVPDCEEGYPLLKSELPPGNLMEQHADHPKVYWPTEEPRITLGYLNFMYSKLVRILKTTTDIVYRQKAVQWCVEMLCTPDSRVRCILAGILPLLAEMAQTEEDMYLKQELTMCFKYASASTEAWDALVDLKCIDKLVEYVASDNKLLRGNALNALNDCCLSDRAQDVIVNKGSTLKFILENINKETDRMNTIAALDILSKCIINLNYCEKAMEELLSVDAVSTALRLMDSRFLDLKESATRFLCLLCFHIKGKDQALKQGAIEKLLPHLHHIEPRIQVFGLAALMSITIAVEGKFRILDAGGIPYIKPMLDLTDDVICLYILQEQGKNCRTVFQYCER